MTTASDIDTAFASLKTASQTYLADGGSAKTLTYWLISNIRTFSAPVAHAVDGGRAVNATTNRGQTFVSVAGP